MTNEGVRTSAKIIQFPIRQPAARDLLTGKRVQNTAPHMTPQIDVGGASYHQAEIEKESTRKGH